MMEWFRLHNDDRRMLQRDTISHEERVFTENGWEIGDWLFFRDWAAARSDLKGGQLTTRLQRSAASCEPTEGNRAGLLPSAAAAEPPIR
jgi:hypothetical protein